MGVATGEKVVVCFNGRVWSEDNFVYFALDEVVVFHHPAQHVRLRKTNRESKKERPHERAGTLLRWINGVNTEI